MCERTLLPTDQILMLAACTKSLPMVLKTWAQYTMWDTQANQMGVGLRGLSEKNQNVNINSPLDVLGWLRGEALLEWKKLALQPAA